MYKKFIFSLTLTIISFIATFSIYMFTLFHPGIYNGIDGFRGALLTADATISFNICFTGLILGLVLCAYDAYKRR
jgi:hypothetical protein